MPKTLTADEILGPSNTSPTADDILGTPSGLPSINESTGPTPDLGAFVNPSNVPTANASPATPSFDPASAAKEAWKMAPGPATVGALALGAAAAPETAGLSLLPALGAEGAVGALGAMGGEAYHQLGQHFMNFVKGLPFGGNGAPSTDEQVSQRLSDAATSGAIQGAGGTLINRGIVKPITNLIGEKILSPAAAKFVFGGQATIDEALTAQQEFGIPKTPAQVTKSPVLQWFENKLRNNPKTAGPLREFDVKQLAAKVEQRNKLLEDGNATSRLEDLGLSIQSDLNRMIQKTELSTRSDVDAIKNSILQSLGSKETDLQLGLDSKTLAENFLRDKQIAKNNAYTNVAAQMPPDVAGPATNFMDQLQKEKANIELGSQPLREEAGTQKQLETINQLIDMNSPKRPPAIQSQIDAFRSSANEVYAKALEDEYPAVPANQTYAQMDANAKLLNAAAQDEFGKTGSPISVTYGKLRQAVRADMANLAQSSGRSDIIDLHAAADALNTDFKNTQESKMLATMIRTKPTAISTALFSPGNDQMISDVEKTFPELYPRLKAKITNNLFDSGGDNLTGDSIRSKLADFGETANTIWDGKTQRQILQAADTIDGRVDFGHAIAKNPVFMAAVKANPTIVADKFIQPGRIGPIVLAKEFLPKEVNDKIGSAFLRKTFVANENGAFDPAASLKTFNEYGDDVYKTLYGDEKAAQYKRFLTLAADENTQKNISHVPARGQMSNSLLGLGAILYGMISRPLATMEALGTTWKLAPLLSKAYLSPFVSDWLTKGISTPATIKAAVPVVNEITGRMVSALSTYAVQSAKNSEEE